MEGCNYRLEPGNLFDIFNFVDKSGKSRDISCRSDSTRGEVLLQFTSGSNQELKIEDIARHHTQVPTFYNVDYLGGDIPWA